MVEQTKTNDATTLILKPNRSASWSESKLLLLLMLIPMTVIGLAWTIVGAWPVLPLVGLEFITLWYLIYLVSYRSYQEDRITIQEQCLTVDNGIGKKRHDHIKKAFSRDQARLIVSKPSKPLDLQLLYIADSKNRLEIGHYLNEDDREKLRIALLESGIDQISEQMT